MPRRLQCIFCQHTFVIDDERGRVGDCPACGTELLDETYIVELALSGARTLEQPLDVDAQPLGFAGALTAPRTIVEKDAGELGVEEDEEDEGEYVEEATVASMRADHFFAFEDITAADPPAGAAEPRARQAGMATGEEAHLGESAEPGNSLDGSGGAASSAGGGNGSVKQCPTGTGFGDDDTTALRVTEIPATAGVDDVDDVDELASFGSCGEEHTVSSNLDLEALAAASYGTPATTRPRWRCPDCSSEFPGARPRRCPICGVQLDDHV